MSVKLEKKLKVARLFTLEAVLWRLYKEQEAKYRAAESPTASTIGRYQLVAATWLRASARLAEALVTGLRSSEAHIYRPFVAQTVHALAHCTCVRLAVCEDDWRRKWSRLFLPYHIQERLTLCKAAWHVFSENI